MREALRLIGLLLILGSLLCLVLGQSAGDCLVLAGAGYALSRWMIGSPE